MQRRSPLAPSALLIVAGATLFLCASVHALEKVPVVIAPGEVTIDGDARPDVGRSFADTIAGGLLNTGSYSIIDPDVGFGDNENAPTAEQVIAGQRDNGAEFAFVPRLVVEEDFNRLTLKKIRVSDGEVVRVYSKTATSDTRSAMFDLLDQTLELVYADVTTDNVKKAEVAHRKTPVPSTSHLDPDPTPVIDVTPPDTPRTEVLDLTPPPTPLASKPKAPPIKKRKGRGVIEDDPPPAPKVVKKTPPAPAPEEIDVPKADEPVAEYAGRLRAVNTDWDFCIIEVAQRGALSINDELIVRGSTSLEPLGTLRVSKVEGSQVVADTLDVPLDMLRAGFKVYRWVEQ